MRRAALSSMLLLLLCLVPASCAQTTLPSYYGAPVAVCRVKDAQIVEASGIIASRRNPGHYYVHNDSGGRPRVFLVDREGRTRLTIWLKGASALDYEDIALAPGNTPDTPDVCIADIGDNRARRSQVTIYRFPEPDVTRNQPGATLELDPRVYHVRYAGGPANAEAFCVHPRTGDAYILTKSPAGGSTVYRLAAPWNAGEVTTLPMYASLEPPPGLKLARVVTAADISPDGRRLAVRCYVNGWEWQLSADEQDSDFKRIFQTTPTQLILPAEQQGEALCYAADGRALLTLSEGKNPTLYEVPATTVRERVKPRLTEPRP